MNRFYIGNKVPWTPAEITTLAWYDASDISTITEGVSGVSQWNDKSGNSRNATQVSPSAQPTTGTVTIGGLNALDFDGSSDVLDVSLGIPITGNVLIMGIVHRYTAGSDTILDGYSGGGQNYSFWWYTDNIIYTYLWNTGTDVESSVQSSVGDFLVGAEKNQAATGYNYLNGTQVGTGAVSNEPVVDIDQIGKYGVTTFSRMKLGELIYCADTSTATRQLIEGYLAHKWGLA